VEWQTHSRVALARVEWSGKGRTGSHHADLLLNHRAAVAG
jgi:hypothetical protein